MLERLLYITRKYPPMKGGMEEASFQLARHLRRHATVNLLSWGGHQAWLPVVALLFFFKSVRLLSRGRVDAVHTGDALLSPLTLLLKAIFDVPVTATVFGLDITWSFPFYTAIVARTLNRLDRVVCISKETRNACVSAGVHEGKIVTIPLGIDPERFESPPSKEEARGTIGDHYGVDLRGRFVLLSVGRFIKRKGFLWFLETVMPQLAETEQKILYFLVGYGPLEDAIRKAILNHGLEDYVLVTNDDRLDEMYAAADLFVMPNIPVKGDMEGFGIVALEAAASGLPVVASRLEGIEDAIVEGQNGVLVEPLSPAGFSTTILRLLSDPDHRTDIGKMARTYTLATFSWVKIAEDYARLFNRLVV